jgi:hypothetical protein
VEVRVKLQNQLQQRYGVSLTQLIVFLWLLVEVHSAVLGKGGAFRGVIAVRAVVVVHWRVAVY